MKKLFYLILILFYSNAAFAADWVFLTSSDNFNVYIDKSGVEHKKRAWVKYESKNEMKKKFDYMLQLVIVNCADNSTALKALASYKNGTLLDSYEHPRPVYKSIIPESIGETILICICDDKSSEILEALKTISPSSKNK